MGAQIEVLNDHANNINRIPQSCDDKKLARIQNVRTLDNSDLSSEREKEEFEEFEENRSDFYNYDEMTEPGDSAAEDAISKVLGTTSEKFHEVYSAYDDQDDEYSDQ